MTTWNTTEAGTLLCPECGRRLDASNLNTSAFVSCASCETPLRVVLFPAYFRDTSGDVRAAEAALDQEAVCFNHPENRAEVACATCGRFICELCQLDITDEQLCPSCFESDRSESSSHERETVLYGKIAVYLSLVPLFCFWPATLITAPASIFIAVYYWNDSRRMISSVRWRNVVAVLLSVLQIAGWATGWISIFVMGP